MKQNLSSSALFSKQNKKFCSSGLKNNLALLLLVFVFFSSGKFHAQEKFGKTLNVGFGSGYYPNVGSSFPAINFNYEFDVIPNFTIAPFIGFSSYNNHVWWRNPNSAYRNYYYRQTIIPAGVKASYYFDKLLDAGPDWDFYAAISSGFVFINTQWQNENYGETIIPQYAGQFYMTIHVGTEYHVNNKLGIFLDLSSGMSSIGLAIHTSGTGN